MPVARYQQLATQLQDEIARGVYPPGSTLPPAEELARRLGWSKVTVGEAYDLLAKQGFIDRVRKRGSVVCDRSAVRVRFSHLAEVMQPSGGQRGGPWETACRDAGVDGSMKMTEVETERAPEHVADALELRPGATVVRRSRLALIGRDVVALHHAWYPQEVAKGSPLERDEKIIGGIYGAFINMGRPPASCSLDFDSRNPSPVEAAELKLPHTPVIVVQRVTRDAAGTPIEYLEIVANPRRTRPGLDDVNPNR
jgi:GntR family transcriptional regulator